MGFLSKLLRLETRAAPSAYLPTSFGGVNLGAFADTGVQIHEGNALINSTVWACVSIIAQTISTLPVHVIDRESGEKQYDHPLFKVLTQSPNPFMTPTTFREVLLTNALLHGGSYAAIERDPLGHVAALYPLRSPDVKPKRENGMLVFECRVGSSTFMLRPDQIVYLLGWSLDGISPVSPVKAGSQAIGLSVAMERYAAKAFSGGNIGGILKTPPMNDDAMKAFITSWKNNYVGIDNAFKVAVLPDPMSFIPTSMDPEKGQMTQAREAQVIEICRYWKVPPSMLGVLSKASYASLEQQNLAFFQQTILPWIVKLEQELALKCFLEVEKPALEIKFNADSLLRASTQERYTAYQTGRQGGWLSINDIRRKEGLPPVDGGDSYLSPLNMTPVNTPGLPAPQNQQEQDEEQEEDETDTDAARALIEDAARRVLTKETKAVTRAAKKHAAKPEEFRAWADDWYAKHQPLVARVFTAPIKAAGLKTTPDTYATQHCEESRKAVLSAIELGNVDDLADEFETIRPGDIAGALLEG